MFKKKKIIKTATYNGPDRRVKNQTPIILRNIKHFQRIKPAKVAPGKLLSIVPDSRKKKRKN